LWKVRARAGLGWEGLTRKMQGLGAYRTNLPEKWQNYIKENAEGKSGLL